MGNSNIYRLNTEHKSSNRNQSHHTRLVEYDDKMRCEEEKYAKLLADLTQSNWFVRHVMIDEIKNNSSIHNEYEEQINKTHFNEHVKIENETRLTEEEIKNNDGITLDKLQINHQQKSENNNIYWYNDYSLSMPINKNMLVYSLKNEVSR